MSLPITLNKALVASYWSFILNSFMVKDVILLSSTHQIYGLTWLRVVGAIMCDFRRPISFSEYSLKRTICNYNMVVFLYWYAYIQICVKAWTGAHLKMPISLQNIQIFRKKNMLTVLENMPIFIGKKVNHHQKWQKYLEVRNAVKKTAKVNLHFYSWK